MPDILARKVTCSMLVDETKPLVTYMKKIRYLRLTVWWLPNGPFTPCGYPSRTSNCFSQMSKYGRVCSLVVRLVEADE